MKNFYQILGIKHGASLEEIKKAYFAMAKKYHPDSGNHIEVERFYQITEAYKFLSDSSKKEEYDLGVSKKKKVDDLFKDVSYKAPSYHSGSSVTDESRQKEAESFYRTQLVHGFIRVTGLASLFSVAGYLASVFFDGQWYFGVLAGFLIGFVWSLHRNFDVRSFVQSTKKQRIFDYLSWVLFGMGVLYFLVLIVF